MPDRKIQVLLAKVFSCLTFSCLVKAFDKNARQENPGITGQSIFLSNIFLSG